MKVVEKKQQKVDLLEEDDLNYKIIESAKHVQNQYQNNQNPAIIEICKLMYQEKLCPDILQYPKDILEGKFENENQTSMGLIELIQKQEEGIEIMKKEINQSKDENKQNKNLFLLLHVIELDRVKFIVKEYLRVRLAKIEIYFLHIENQKLHSFLSHSEINHLKRFIQLKAQIFDFKVLDNLKLKGFGLIIDGQKKGAEKKIIDIPSPLQNKYVFAKITTSQLIKLGANQLQKGDIFLVRYSIVQKQVQNDQIQIL